MTDGKVWAVLSYIFILWILPLWVIKPRNVFAVYHAKQGLGLFLLGIIVNFVAWIPFVGWALAILFLILWIIGIVNAIRGAQQPVPLVGKYFEQWFASI